MRCPPHKLDPPHDAWQVLALQAEHSLKLMEHDAQLKSHATQLGELGVRASATSTKAEVAKLESDLYLALEKQKGRVEMVRA